MKRTFATVALACAAALPPAALAGNISLMIDGIPGPVEVLSYGFGATQTVVFDGGGGGGTGKVKFGPFSFTATESAASPLQFDNLNKGKHITGARLIVLHPDTGKPQSEWVLTDLLLSSFKVGNGAPDPKAKQPNTFMVPTTAFEVVFMKACYRVFAADGSVAREACWNVATNSAT